MHRIITLLEKNPVPDIQINKAQYLAMVYSGNIKVNQGLYGLLMTSRQELEDLIPLIQHFSNEYSKSISLLKKANNDILSNLPPKEANKPMPTIYEDIEFSSELGGREYLEGEFSLGE